MSEHEPESWDVIVVGAGAAGLLAATRAAKRGKRTLLLEKNKRPGVKILMSGGTRCNLTHDTDEKGIVREYGPSGRFLHSALSALGTRDLIALVEAEGVATKIEETGKVFPVSNRAVDILEAFLRLFHRSGATLRLEEPLQTITREDEAFQLITTRHAYRATKVVVTTGGKSYPGSGTTGDGFAWARNLGHTIVAPRPALVPITVNAPWTSVLRGITIPDVHVQVIDPKKTGKGKKVSVLAERRGSLLFAHFGLSGPVILDVSRVVSGHPEPTSLHLVCDFLPDTSEVELEQQLQEASVTAGNRQLATVLSGTLPRWLVESILEQAGLSPDRRSAELRKEDRQGLVAAVKRMKIPVKGTLGFEKAEVTAGGVSLAEVDSRTMESKLVPGLYFAGEVLDLDGPIGGFNFQAAFSTGWLAGERV
ncbi:MAG: NAD(P)/FAD-dependent oxidoreductase [Planctomycetota bacterium]